MRKSLAIMILLVFGMGSLPWVRAGSSQQSGESPLLELLRLVPDTPSWRESGDYLVYADFRANERAAELIRYETAEQFFTADEDEQRWWIAAASRTVYFSFAPYLLEIMEALPTLYNFEWFDVDRIVEFGTPPDRSVIYEGTFDPDAMPFADHGFAQETRNGVAVWWLDEDYRQDFTRRDPADPFIGPLGVSARVIALPDKLIHTRAWGAMDAIIAARNGEGSSLADAPDYQALAEALSSGDGDLISAILFTTQSSLAMALPPADPLTPQPSATPDPAASLPPYLLVGFADRQVGESQVHRIGLVYPDPDSAQQAAQILAARLENGGGVSIMTGTDMREIFTDLGVVVDEPQVYTSPNGLAVALVSVRYPLLPQQQAEGSNSYVQPARLFRRWMQMVFARDIGWLALAP